MTWLCTDWEVVDPALSHGFKDGRSYQIDCRNFMLHVSGVVGSGNGVVYLTSPGRPTEIGLQLGKACCPCSR